MARYGITLSSFDQPLHAGGSCRVLLRGVPGVAGCGCGSRPPRSHPPGRAAKLGVDYETLSALNPRLIYCATTGYGQDGPYAQLAGHDLNYIGFSGFLSLLEGPGGRPCIPQNMVADYAGGAWLRRSG